MAINNCSVHLCCYCALRPQVCKWFKLHATSAFTLPHENSFTAKRIYDLKQKWTTQDLKLSRHAMDIAISMSAVHDMVQLKKLLKSVNLTDLHPLF